VKPIHLPIRIEGSRLTLLAAGPVASDAAEVITREHTRFALYFPMLAPSVGPELLPAAFATEAQKLWANFEEYAYELRTAESRFVGHLSVHALAWKHDCAELAYWVRADAEGQGFVKEAVHIAETALFGLGFHRLEIRCDVRNEPSRKVAERCGYRLEARLREHMRRRDGSYRDSYVFGKLAGEVGLPSPNQEIVSLE
jgi:RimJ/RimL family protein N-acetyltransferase